MSNGQLPLFEGKPVTRSTLRITKAGYGLSEALKLEPRALQLGDDVCFVLKGTVEQVNHREADELISRVHTVAVTDIAAVEHALATEIIDAEAERLTKLRDEQNGQLRIENP